MHQNGTIFSHCTFDLLYTTNRLVIKHKFLTLHLSSAQLFKVFCISNLQDSGQLKLKCTFNVFKCVANLSVGEKFTSIYNLSFDLLFLNDVPITDIKTGVKSV